DQKLADFRAQNAGRLPEEMQLNAQEMNALANRTGSLNEQANRNNEQRMMLETALRTAKDRLAAIKDVNPAVQVRNERVSELDRTMQNLQLQIENMKDQYTDDFPDLQAARKQLAMLQRQKDDLLKQTPKKPDVALDNSGIARERLEAQGSIDGIEAQLKANAMEAQQIQHEIGMSNAQLGAFQARMQAIPAGEKEYLQLMNDRELAKAHYQDLEMKREKSSMSMDLERRKQGESLEILDAASVPVAPTAPKRPLIIALGPGIGLVLGFVLVAVREVKDTSLKNLKDARLYTQLPILGSVPLLENDLVVQHRKQMMWLGWATATLAGLGIIAVSIAHYYMSRA
ncbi:MAG: hypothetical protein JO061_05065, partial [Acidobacteriaceae bacterium]|nr:hypothetical protein [Acidobacteriaceae bacterium]